MYRRIAVLAVGAALGLAAQQSAAKVGPEEAAKLGQALTPVGAEKAGNADGSIPAWTPAKQRGKVAGEYASDAAIDAEATVFTITKANMAQYGDKLTAGHKRLLGTHETYKMNVYPSHRVVTWPDDVLKATVANATTAEMVGTEEVINAKLGFPFPIPANGAEVIWNHKLKYRGEAVRRYNNQMIVQPSGEYQITKIIEDVKFYYANTKSPTTLTKENNTFIKYLSQVIAPPRMAGTFILVHEKGGSGNDGRAAWLYSPGLKRIRRAPTVCCDNPYEGTDGHQFYDQVDMFNGTMERYNWKLVGKKEMYIPYDSNKISGPQTKFKDMAKPKHLNQDLPRYELHRVWVVEANIKPGTNHTFTKRVFYVDEDGWQIAAVENYDSRGQLYQFQEGHVGFGYNVLVAGTVPEVIYHFTSGRYFVTAMANEDKPNDFSVNYDDNFFESASVQKRTTR
ncbi:MAG: DUF1329 domain-containing protein [Gammaproteobacteria bacterium]|nr:DUF1329 domain-containing protein [Gammaproteobacteria bacterium]